MADEFEDYIFESKRNTGNDFALANGDVTSVLRGFRFHGTASVPSRKRFSRIPGGAANKRVGIGLGGLSVTRPQIKSFSFSTNGRNASIFSSGFAIDAGKRAAFSVTQEFSSASAGRNTSNGVDLTLKEQETPVFSGLFANHDSGAFAGNGTAGSVSVPAARTAGLALSSDDFAAKILSAGGAEIISEVDVLSGLSVRIPEKTDILKAIDFFQSVKGVKSVVRDPVYHPIQK